jgi:hypothetical protein
MNIAQIKQLQAVDGWVDFPAQIKEIKEIRQRTKSNLSKTPGQPYNVQKLFVQDETDTIGLWAYANQTFMVGQIVNIHGMVKEFQGNRYLDFCELKQNGQNTAQNIPQAPQNAPQPTKAGNDRNTSIERQCAWKGACNRARGSDMTPNDIVELARQGIYFIETGNNPNDLPEYDEAPSTSEQLGSDIPF